MRAKAVASPRSAAKWTPAEVDAYRRAMFDLWRTQEGLLQSYRGYLLTTQSLLLAVAILFLRERGMMVAAGALPIVLGMWVLHRLRALHHGRGQDVTWTRGEVLRIEAGDAPTGNVRAPLSAFLKWQELPPKAKAAHLERWDWKRAGFPRDPLKPGPARRFFERQLPAVLGGLWIALLGVWTVLMALYGIPAIVAY